MTEIFKAGSSYWRGRLSTVDLLVKIACEENSFSTESILSELVSTRRSIVLIFPLQEGFPGQRQLVELVGKGDQSYWSFPFRKDSLVKDKLFLQSSLMFVVNLAAQCVRLLTNIRKWKCLSVPNCWIEVLSIWNIYYLMNVPVTKHSSLLLKIVN